MGKRKLLVIDFETDPFLHDRLPIPFAWGAYDGENYWHDWTPRAWETPRLCARTLVDFLKAQAAEGISYIIYAHNGGKFDFLFFLDELDGAIKIVNGRILQASMAGHVLRDSYAIMPIPLSQLGDKVDIDYQLMERDVREDHRDEILHYMKRDCIELFKAVEAFIAEFGDILTIGSASMRQLKKFHEFDTASEDFDADFRKFYFGGRCQCFETGVIETPMIGIDLNSSYPHTMRSMKHPVSTQHTSNSRISKATAFVTWEGENFGAVPTRTKTGLDFTVRDGTFHTTIHEWEAGLETGTIKPRRIVEAIDFRLLLPFGDFIDHFYTSRLAAKAKGDKFKDLFYKLILNSAYGKFAQSPENFEDSIILPYGDFPATIFSEPGVIAPDIEQYQILHTNGEYAIWSKPSKRKTYFNVATAASITGGSRATLLRGLAAAKRPLYCDTDSIYCEAFGGDLDDTRLGAWKHEFTGHQIAIAGKKLYAVMGTATKDDPKKGVKKGDEVCLKKASKGTRLHPLAIFMIARGDTCETRNDAPSFKLDGKHVFIKRNIRKTTAQKLEIPVT